MKTRYPYVIRGFNPTARHQFDCKGVIEQLPSFVELTADDPISAVSKMFTGFPQMHIAPLSNTPPRSTSYVSSVEQRVKRVVAEQLGLGQADGNNGSFISDLGADSLDLVELCMALEDEFELEVDDRIASSILTVQQAIDYVLAQLYPTSTPAAPAEPDLNVVDLDLVIYTNIMDQQDLRSIRSDLRETLKRWAEKSRVKGTRGWRLSALKAPKFERADDNTYMARVKVILGAVVFYDENSSKLCSSSALGEDIDNLKRKLKKSLAGTFTGLST